MKNTAGTWDRNDRNVYFLAGSIDMLNRVDYDYVLVAVNEIKTDKAMTRVEEWVANGRKVLIDSGIFWLTNQHARKHSVSMDIALALAPAEIDGFDKLWNRYTEIMKRIGNQVWGYIELDQGGIKNKRITRAKLEDLGLTPMPVYHPLNDGADYFDELAENYDRMCMGNIVQAMPPTRLRLMHSLWERHRKYPDLWVHTLGLTPNQTLNAFPSDSADSSAWLNVVRWSGYKEKSMLAPFSDLPRHFQYKLQDTQSHYKAIEHGATGAYMNMLNWQHWINEVNENLGMPLYPAPLKGEPRYGF